MNWKEILNMLNIRHVEDEEYPSIDDPDFKEKAKLKWMQSMEEIPYPSGWSK